MKYPLLALILFIVSAQLSGQTILTDKRDGNTYRTVVIGKTTWMSENLKFKAVSGSFYFDNDSNNVHVYGVLYEWETAKKACPAGWRLPTGAEFQSLIDHYEQKETWGKKPTDPNSFGIQLGGMQDYEGTFSEMDESAYYWTSAEYDKSNAEYFSYLMIDDEPVIDISRKEDIADIHGSEKSNRYSVRCVKE
jgi:uncharacterized protein (TIGR02145 family)